MIDWPLVGARFVHLTALMILAGSSLFALLIAGGVPPRRWLIPAAAAAALSAVGWLFAVAAAMSDRSLAAVDAATLRLVLGATAFGHVWKVQLALAGATLAVAAWRGGRGCSVLVFALAAALLTGVAAVGHAGMAGGSTGLLHIGNDAVHLLAAAVWLGGLVPLAALLYRASSGNGSPPATLHAIELFSTMAIAAVAVVLLTGTANLQWLLNSAAGIASDWGRVLAIKLGLVAGLLVLAAINRLILLPRLHRAASAAREGAAVALYRTVLFEQMVAVMVLTAASLLGTLPPPVAAASPPRAFQQVVGGAVGSPQEAEIPMPVAV